MSPLLDVLIPTCDRPAALAVTLASLVGQDFPSFRVTVSDQTLDPDAAEAGEVLAVARVLRDLGRPVVFVKHLPRRGMAEHRDFLLSRARTGYALFLDDDLILEPGVVRRMLAIILAEGCGFVGCAPIGLSHLGDVRPAEERLEWWDGPVRPESVRPGTAAWQRHTLHNAANVLHVQRRLGLSTDSARTYRVAWVGGCVLYDVRKLRDCGGFGFWRELPASGVSGEDVVAQLRVMERFGGCGILPSGVYHQELPTTVDDRRHDAWRVHPELLDAPAGVPSR
ncbi:MAG TPA: glycosyltransferase family A protein [Coriobacteriia bacterium]